MEKKTGSEPFGHVTGVPGKGGRARLELKTPGRKHGPYVLSEDLNGKEDRWLPAWAWPPQPRPRPQASTKRLAWRRIWMEVDHSLTAVLDHRRGLSEARLEAGATLRASTSARSQVHLWPSGWDKCVPSSLLLS